VAGNNTTIGVLALQGAVREHLEMIEQCGARGVGIKRPSGLNHVNGLIIPGGESTTIGKLIDEYGFTGELKKLGESGIPIYGTCAGLIILSQRIRGRHGSVLGLADVTVERNAFGRQVDSFEKKIPVRGIEDENRPGRAGGGGYGRCGGGDRDGAPGYASAWSVPPGADRRCQDTPLLPGDGQAGGVSHR
jgi:pyridoxal 5'-phosphate synthase glutaminase subunit Pdx2